MSAERRALDELLVAVQALADGERQVARAALGRARCVLEGRACATWAGLDAPAFAARALEAARRVGAEGRFPAEPSGGKVFIGAAWRAAESGLTLAKFKERLVEAHRAGHVELSRADLVEAMDPKLVQESRATYLGAEWHLIRVREGWR